MSQGNETPTKSSGEQQKLKDVRVWIDDESTEQEKSTPSQDYGASTSEIPLLEIIQGRLADLEHKFSRKQKEEDRNDLHLRKNCVRKEIESIEKKAEGAMNVLLLGVSFYVGFVSMIKCRTLTYPLIVTIMSLAGITLFGIMTFLKLKYLAAEHARVLAEDVSLKKEVAGPDEAYNSPAKETDLKIPLLPHTSSIQAHIEEPVGVKNFTMVYILPAAGIYIFSVLFAIVLLVSMADSCGM